MTRTIIGAENTYYVLFYVFLYVLYDGSGGIGLVVCTVYPNQLPPNDAYLIFSAAILHVFNLTLSDKSFRDHARPRLERCIEWLRVNVHSFLIESKDNPH